MFDFQKEVIINSAVVDGDYPKVQYESGKLRVARCADYMASNVTDIKKTMPVDGVAETVTLVSPGKGIAKVVIEVGLDETRMYGDYANDWAKFCKTVIAECETAGTAADVETIAKAINMALPENYKFIKVDKTGKVSCTDSHQILKTVEISLSTDNGENFVVVKTKKDLTSTPRVREIGTAAWLVENLRFPTYPNLRYAALHEEEKPVDGAKYIQYTFEYVSPRKGLHGQGTVGQRLESVTTHTFYVLNTLSTVIKAFDDFVTAATTVDSQEAGE